MWPRRQDRIAEPSERKQAERPMSNTMLGVAIGPGVGLSLGLALGGAHGIPLGLAIGSGAGVAIGAALDEAARRHGRGPQESSEL